MLTERQETILTFIVDDFLNVMTPISSKYLLDKYNFDVSSATIETIWLNSKMRAIKTTRHRTCAVKKL